ncbi:MULTISPECIES: SDR family NAD(P)-dependent oxidoreductase [unclassified Janthinobacterium]|uniref:SDR family NAD(P)-dependent oxidoreductase n=1 Tax=unclassified Janthinobacterium TaxID=2610881 RepID=UPI000C172FC9|nr:MULTISPECIES: SDR family oxidoreductase [unclassified Janthinobacterium]MDO8049294.1 SDR family NAD(P)-dependent oxidoreductase [Janthinobacterium sp. SUN211]MDO8073957.1 SDR family NAD(P)-dependent oxidoreductase [Janthinobacterium sp. SUN176]MED5614582.1 SDR family oxidoreductase [Janthinobacterium sp. P210005]PIF10509.1 NAD(P)-dependent dehydrogenase (short-subunit alcohol dehydrogenase family) [Janthinobacterium sp. 13]
MKQLAKYGSLQGKRVFITGGGSGIGESLVAEFAAQGAVVAFVDIAVEASEALCRRLAEAGWTAPVFRHCDITDIASLQAVMAELADQLGDFDILVNNAANDQRHQAQDVTLEYWNERIAINQRPMFFTCQAVFEGMKRKGGGSIINVSSISWHMKSGGYPVYATTKAAVVGLTRGLARDYGAHNIRVNTVTPGWVMTQRQIDLWVDEAAEVEIKKSQCLPSKLMPQDIAAMVLFLASDDGAMCSSQEFIVDAGWV